VPLRVALVTYSTKPRGGVVHTLALAEALAAKGTDVEVIALGDPSKGFYRSVDVPCHVIEAPAPAATLTERVFASLDALADGLARTGERLAPVLHTQDCIAARAACRVRDGGAPVTVVRTVHHVDDFTTPALVECQQRAIVEPDRVLVVSKTWQRTLLDDHGVDAEVVPNGVDLPRFEHFPGTAVVDALRSRVGATGRFLVLAVGGIEPRKGSDHLIRSLARLRDLVDEPPVLAVVGGHSFQDHRAYRQSVLEEMASLGLRLGTDVVLVGTVPDEELPAWYHAADVLAFPSINEGWGLAVLEAMAAGLPVVATDIPVLREYLASGSNALLVTPGDDAALAAALRAVMTNASLGRRLAAAGRRLVTGYGWDVSAERHLDVYRRLSPVQGLSPAQGAGDRRS